MHIRKMNDETINATTSMHSTTISDITSGVSSTLGAGVAACSAGRSTTAIDFVPSVYQ
uniref:Uncharacterized protein n=1 Tax=Parascaris univalens TaxID=6257 RepID=A0A915AYV4_PARUN